MSRLFRTTKSVKHIFSQPLGVARVDDCRVLSGIIHVILYGLRWRDVRPTKAT
ncbi:hypothetical protein PH7735_03244 [Shimia thalassica]|uniref:Transposase n=1 Tax=Shimia thalassica TaxID=1715693 RepID=A0A0P1IKS1_9RHOB|nr:hypothetical protein PH7735_03244 [Shimia thalassica]